MMSLFLINEIRVSNYSGGLKSEHLNRRPFEIQTFLSSDLEWFSFGMAGHSYSYGTNHSKTEPFKIQTKWGPFWWSIQKLDTIQNPNAYNHPNSETGIQIFQFNFYSRQFAESVEHLLRREEQWNTWKNDGCQALISPTTAAATTAAKNGEKVATTLGGKHLILFDIVL